MTATEVLARRIDELCVENEKLRQRHEGYEAGYIDGSTHYELEHCPACKNIADLQEALAENAKLRELVFDMWDFFCVVPDDPLTFKEELDFSYQVWKRMQELGIETDRKEGK